MFRYQPLIWETNNPLGPLSPWSIIGICSLQAFPFILVFKRGEKKPATHRPKISVPHAKSMATFLEPQIFCFLILRVPLPFKKTMRVVNLNRAWIKGVKDGPRADFRTEIFFSPSTWPTIFFGYLTRSWSPISHHFRWKWKSYTKKLKALFAFSLSALYKWV